MAGKARCEILGIVPARGGSKGIPRKNVVICAGKPLISWTLEAARKAPFLTRLIVSTDDGEIARVARRWGAQVPFMRPRSLARDTTPGLAPVFHALEWLKEHENYCPDYVVVLQPTSPLRTSRDIQDALGLLIRTQADSIVSVSRAAEHPYLMKKIDARGRVRDFIPSRFSSLRRQDLPAVYALNGALYASRYRVLMGRQTWYTDKTIAYVMPPERSVDVDSISDVRFAGMLLKKG